VKPHLWSRSEAAPVKPHLQRSEAAPAGCPVLEPRTSTWQPPNLNSGKSKRKHNQPAGSSSREKYVFKKSSLPA
jgi:hypothetical protein